MNICYSVSPYISHERAAADYRAILAERHTLVPVERHHEADVVVLHHPPHLYEAIYQVYPALARRYVIAYAVWEATRLPEAYAAGLRRPQEIWTCSRFCQRAFEPYHPRVTIVPHVVERDRTCTAEERRQVAQAIGYDPDLIYFLAVTRLSSMRKNAAGLARVFQRAAEAMPRARLIVKAVSDTPKEPPVVDPRIIWITHAMTDQALNALYGLSHIYVSAHRAEGWGLTLSDAMLFRRPAIAPRYSGNLEFMNDDNSWLVDSREAHIAPEECTAFFTPEMQWGYVDEAALEQMMIRLYRTHDSAETARKVERAAQDVSRFSRAAVRDLLLARIDAIEHQYIA